MAFPPLADLLIYRDLILAGQARRRIPDAAPTAGASSHHARQSERRRDSQSESGCRCRAQPGDL